MANVLVTGGAGFVGSHLVDALVARGHRVRIFDSLEPQVHMGLRPTYLNDRAEFLHGEMTDRDALRRALLGVDVVFHQAAVVGVGQSMYKIEHYVRANTLGGAVLLDLLVNEGYHKNLKKLVVASSMSVYGEGAYECSQCGPFYPGLRAENQLAERRWEIVCPEGHSGARPVPTNETKPLAPASIYAITKRDHEEMFLCVGRACQVPTVALRYFNIYGPRQAVTNPYTGVAAIFAGQLLGGDNPLVFEDGAQQRDFVHISDIVQANLLAMERPEADYQVFNIGSGRAVSVLQVAAALIRHLRSNALPNVVGRSRVGDVRHCVADITKARSRLNYRPRVQFEQEGVNDLISWVVQQRVGTDPTQRSAHMMQELNAFGLTR